MKRGTTIAGTKQVGKAHCLGLMLVIVSLSGSTALALDPMGPPGCVLRRGDYKVTLDYALGQMDLDLTNGRWTSRLDGAPQAPELLNSKTIKDFETQRVCAGLGYGVLQKWDVFARLGAANATFGDSIWDLGEDFEGNNDLLVGAGIKGTFYETERLRLGGLLQGSYAEYDGKMKRSGWPLSDSVEATITEAQLAVGVTYFWTRRVSLYAGPFAHYMSGDFDYTFALIDIESGDLERSVWAWEIDNGLAYGGYLGAQISFGRNGLFTIEYQQTSDANTIGMGVLWRI